MRRKLRQYPLVPETVHQQRFVTNHLTEDPNVGFIICGFDLARCQLLFSMDEMSMEFWKVGNVLKVLHHSDPIFLF